MYITAQPNKTMPHQLRLQIMSAHAVEVVCLHRQRCERHMSQV